MKKFQLFLVLFSLSSLIFASSPGNNGSPDCLTDKELVGAIYEGFNEVGTYIDKCSVINLEEGNTLMMSFETVANAEKKLLTSFYGGGSLGPKACTEINVVVVVLKKVGEYLVAGAKISDCTRLAQKSISWEDFLNNCIYYKTISNY